MHYCRQSAIQFFGLSFILHLQPWPSRQLRDVLGGRDPSKRVASVFCTRIQEELEAKHMHRTGTGSLG